MGRSFDVGHAEDTYSSGLRYYAKRKEHHVRYIQKWTIRKTKTRRGRKKLRVAVAISEVDYALRFHASPLADRSPSKDLD